MFGTDSSVGSPGLGHVLAQGLQGQGGYGKVKISDDQCTKLDNCPVLNRFIKSFVGSSADYKGLPCVFILCLFSSLLAFL